jgi:hypothetical protein
MPNDSWWQFVWWIVMSANCCAGSVATPYAAVVLDTAMGIQATVGVRGRRRHAVDQASPALAVPLLIACWC